METDDEGEYVTEDDGEVVIKKSKKVYFDPSNKVPVIEKGMIFDNPNQLKHALNKLAVACHRDFRFQKK